jgi:hypothetical protein
VGLRSLPLCTFRKLLGYGRIGTVGRSRSYVVRDEGEARHLARSIFKRRASAPRRIGVAYRIRELIDPAGLGQVSWRGNRAHAMRNLLTGELITYVPHISRELLAVSCCSS